MCNKLFQSQLLEPGVHRARELCMHVWSCGEGRRGYRMAGGLRAARWRLDEMRSKKSAWCVPWSSSDRHTDGSL